MFLTEGLELDESYVDDNDICGNNNVYLSLSEDTVIPKEGNFLGLDISQNSSGICVYRNGVKEVYNSCVSYDKRNPHAESLMRKQLKEDLLEVIGDTILDLVVIEDVFEGSNAEVVRKLYALNTAIDDLIIEGKVQCKEFVRISNGTWKSWLSTVDSEGIYKGYTDKEKIQGYLSMLGVVDEGEGFQDRLDATGMILGYFLKGRNHKESSIVKRRLNISINDVLVDFEPDIDLITSNASYESDETNVTLISDTRLTKNKILEYLSSDLSAIYITSEPIRLGLLAKTFNLSFLEDDGKGYFGFWLSDKAKKKYKQRIERMVG